MNDTLKEYLDYYIDLEIEPNYAVLIRGDWGSGKTWFIKNYLDDKDDIDSLYITLYGINSKSDIDDQLFRQLHPVLSSKGMMITGKILRGFAKGALKVDLNSDGESDGSLNLAVPDLDLPDFLTDTKDHVLVFDDLERAHLQPEELLGYINQFVEHNGQKVIIVANEIEIEDSKTYSNVKEKVIGRSFTVNSSFKKPFNSFVDDITDDSLREILHEHEESISVIFKNSKTNNLRHLRHGLNEFERIYLAIDEISPNCTDNDELISDLIEFYFSIFIGINSGNLKTEDLKDFRIKIHSSVMRTRNQEEESKLVKFLKKYPTIVFENSVLSDEFWYDFFEKGVINKDQIKALENASKYLEESKPAWLKMWDHFYLTNEELEEVLEEIEEKFRENEFSSFGELAHITGSLMRLNNVGLYDMNKQDLYKRSVNQLDNLFGETISVTLKKAHIRPRDHSMGYQFQGLEIDEFKDFLKYFEEKYAEEREGLLQEEADKMIQIMGTNSKKFKSLISINSQKNYNLFPFLDKFDLDEFVEKFKEINPTQRRDVLKALSDRISIKSLEANEIVWINDLLEILKEEFPSDEKTIENYNVNKGIEMLESNLSEIQTP